MLTWYALCRNIKNGVTKSECIDEIFIVPYWLIYFAFFEQTANIGKWSVRCSTNLETDVRWPILTKHKVGSNSRMVYGFCRYCCNCRNTSYSSSSRRSLNNFVSRISKWSCSANRIVFIVYTARNHSSHYIIVSDICFFTNPDDNIYNLRRISFPKHVCAHGVCCLDSVITIFCIYYYYRLYNTNNFVSQKIRKCDKLNPYELFYEVIL